MTIRSISAWRICVGVLLFIASLLCAPYLFMLGVMGVFFPPVVNSALSIFVAITLAVLSIILGASAPRRRKLQGWVAAVMIILWSTALLQWQRLSGRELFVSVLVATMGIAGVILWSMRIWAGACLVASVALLSAALADWPVWPDSIPEPLLQAAAGHPGSIERFHCYYLGGFIDYGWLWRIDAKPDVLEAIVPKLGLSKVDSAPPDFWKMRPYYWPVGCRRERSYTQLLVFRAAREISISC
jgi:hypothetical protein